LHNPHQKITSNSKKIISSAEHQIARYRIENKYFYKHQSTVAKIF